MYRITLDEFEGPLDLLLFFIKRDELDIFDIPIARIADEFLEYVRVLERLDLDRVGEFVYMAALLIEIKAKMMLPRPELDEEGEPIDPRQELVRRLLEYQRYKQAALQMNRLSSERDMRFTREAAARVARSQFQVNGEDDEYEVSVFHLLSALNRMLKQASQVPTHQVQAIDFTIEEQRTFVMTRLRPGTASSFGELVQRQPKLFVIVTFLAVLEMVREGMLRLMERVADHDFYVERIEGYAEESG